MFQNLRVAVRLALGFGLVIALTVATCILGISALASQSQRMEELATVQTPALVLAGEWRARIEEAAKDMRTLFIVPEEDLLEEIAHIRQGRQQRDRVQAELARLVQSARAQAALKGVAEAGKAYLALEQEFLLLAQAGRMEEARDMMLNRIRRPQFAYIEAIGSLGQVLAAEARTLNAESAALAQSGLAQMATATAASMLLAVLFALVVTRSITRPMQEAVAAARRVAEGDLTVEIRTGRRDEAGHLLEALQEMTKRLRQLLAQVASGAHVVVESSAQIAQGNRDLSQRTEDQAGTLQETASSMEELTSTVSLNADHAREASTLAAGASAVARRGGEVVGQVVSTMNGITESSRRISEITAVIDGIAFQTNILALNAAVEAARAGEQGRGFAVVAAEVRALAQRSAAAAREIEALIGESVQKVDAGALLVDSAGRTMDEIVEAVRKVSELVADIASASQEQSSGIEQVSTAVTRMDQVVQQNATLVEQASAATESMRAQAGRLLQLVSRFRLQAQEPAAQVRQERPAAPARAPVAAAASPLGLARTPPSPPRPLAPAPAPAALAARNAAPQVRGEWREF